MFSPLSPLLKLMRHLAWLAVVLLVLAPVVSRALSHASGFLEVALCRSGTLQPALSDPMTAPGLAKTAQVEVGALAAWPDIHHDLQQAGSHVGFACDYCVLAARLLTWLLVALVTFALVQASLPGERVIASGLSTARWRAHAPRGPPLLA
ncbi:DUF2946 family protein [Xanthomonas campestris pv. campestris]|uniref:DUF2946 family protein n=2 Tax=Xanthomonas TaxID=338 RepID=UPI0016A3BDD7|nr:MULTISPECIES: DUF2946 family protein [Xanthomonas]MEB1199380.1 DUF2946 family protein [Xanthomonas campestris pv. campestris]MEA9534127.1 DUF2946 family protein [Xanthomonas campestris]MEB1270027.1 DUF2946 family protein [Xanthomonas campestris pv. campestris]MEB1282475.1 DUF2946 family protein [Xanthomonas campestris pv. campestris]MEB1344889.1 DUF2946 family protein [Xanthomonas campestris pv. campestris]